MPYRCLERIEIRDDIINELATAAQLTASCFNNQPWRFIFVEDIKILEKMREVMNKGNEWTYAASMMLL